MCAAVGPAVVRILVCYLRQLQINVLLRWQQTPNRGITMDGVAMNTTAGMAESIKQGDDESTGVPVRVWTRQHCCTVLESTAWASCDQLTNIDLSILQSRAFADAMRLTVGTQVLQGSCSSLPAWCHLLP
jgi:hypothetical protein